VGRRREEGKHSGKFGITGCKVPWEKTSKPYPLQDWYRRVRGKETAKKAFLRGLVGLAGTEGHLLTKSGRWHTLNGTPIWGEGIECKQKGHGMTRKSYLKHTGR